MKVVIIGLKKEKLASYLQKKYPELQIVQRNPDLIICYGGDGTLLLSERRFPNKPKVLIRNSQICNKCSRYTKDAILKLLLKKKFNIRQETKLEARVKNKKIIALNDILITHQHYNKALRFTIDLNGQSYGSEFLGDGLVIATPLGSTGYYQSITRNNFYEGLGLAFNNTINIIGHLVISDKTKIKVKITRGPGIVVDDNNDQFIKVDTNSKIYIKKAKEPAQIITFGEEYNHFNIDTSQNRFPLGYCQICHCKV